MPTRQRPQSLKLRKIQSDARAKGTDIGNLHVIDYWLHRATRNLISVPWYGYCSSRIGRYLDGEEEIEGTYR